MNARLTLALLCITAFSNVVAQNSIFIDAFEDFTTSRLWNYEPIRIEWNMEGTIQADLNEGLNNLLEEKPALAEASLTAVLEKDSTIWQAYYYRAAARKQQRNLKDAERDLTRALKLHADFYEGYVELAKLLHLRRQSIESERAINKAIRISKSQGAAYYLKGDINLSQNQMKAAINNYNDCLKADSLFHDARIKLALLDLISDKKTTTALSRLTKVLAYDSLQKTALLFRAVLGYDTDKKQAVRDLSNLIVVSPNDLMARYLRGIYNTEQGNYYQAFSDFHKVIQGTSTSDNNFKGQQTTLDKKIDLQNAGAYTVTRVYGLPESDGMKIKQAYCFILTERFDESITVINSISNPDKEPLAVYLKAVAHEHKGQHTTALQLYNDALVLDNEIADAHKKRAIYFQELKRWEHSIKDLTEVLRLTPDAFVIYKIRGTSYYHNNEFNKAIDDFSAYLKYDSANNEVMGYRGMAYRGNKQELTASVDFAISRNYHAIDLKRVEQLIDSVLVRGDTTLALYYLNTITGEIDYFTEGYIQLFKISQARNDWAPIEQNINRAIRNMRQGLEKPKHSYLLTLLAIVHSRNRHHDDAVSTLGEAIKLDKKNSLAYLERGRLFLAMGKSTKAQDDLKQASLLGNTQATAMLAKVSK